MEAIRTIINKYEGRCIKCGCTVRAGNGKADQVVDANTGKNKWLTRHDENCCYTKADGMGWVLDNAKWEKKTGVVIPLPEAPAVKAETVVAEVVIAEVAKEEVVVASKPVIASKPVVKHRHSCDQEWVDMIEKRDEIEARAKAEILIRDLKVARPDTLSDKARAWALDVQRRLVSDLFAALDSALAAASIEQETTMLACMRDYAISALHTKINASIWIDWRNDKITAKNISEIASGLSASGLMLSAIYNATALERIKIDCEAEIQFAAEERAAKEQEFAAEETLINKIEEARQTNANVVFTLHNTQTNNSYTYCISVRVNAILVSVAAGEDKTGKNSALFVGELADDFSLTVSPACVLPKTSKRLRALVWLFSCLASGKEIPAHIVIDTNPPVTFDWRDGGEARVVSWGREDDYEVDDLGEEVSYYGLIH